jgi:hypothetical protein
MTVEQYRFASFTNLKLGLSVKLSRKRLLIEVCFAFAVFYIIIAFLHFQLGLFTGNHDGLFGFTWRLIVNAFSIFEILIALLNGVD